MYTNCYQYIFTYIGNHILIAQIYVIRTIMCDLFLNIIRLDSINEYSFCGRKNNQFNKA